MGIALFICLNPRYNKIFVYLWKRRIKRDKCLRNACQ